MIRDVRISSIEDLMPLLSEDAFDDAIGRHRGTYVYRGLPDSSFHMVTSLRRNCKELQKELEPAILKNYTKYAAFEDPTIERSVWYQMVSGQHHGLPTRLLDWSHSALVALHFATVEDNMDDLDKHDAVIWRIDIPEIHSLLPSKYLSAIEKSRSKVMSIDTLSSITTDLTEYDNDMSDRSFIVMEPPSTETRIVNQYSFFAIVPMGIGDLEEYLNEKTENTVRYIIDKDLRWRIRDMLDSLNISERILFPSLDGIASWIGRHYYVK